MNIPWTEVQKQRLKEFNAPPELLEMSFTDQKQRNAKFQEIEQELVNRGKKRLNYLRQEKRRPSF